MNLPKAISSRVETSIEDIEWITDHFDVDEIYRIFGVNQYLLTTSQIRLAKQIWRQYKAILLKKRRGGFNMTKPRIQITIYPDTGMEEVEVEGGDYETHREALDFMNEIEGALEDFDRSVYHTVETHKKDRKDTICQTKRK